MKLTIKEKLIHLVAGLVFTSVVIGGLLYCAAIVLFIYK